MKECLHLTAITKTMKAACVSIHEADAGTMAGALGAQSAKPVAAGTAHQHCGHAFYAMIATKKEKHHKSRVKLCWH